jgi:uncharacterized OB-fold protein
MAERKIPFGESNPETKAFWDAATEGKFILRRCTECQRVHWYPRAICPHCASADTEWVPASGRGKIYSFSVMQRAEVPYTIAYVALEEGTTMLTNIVGCDFATLKIGQDVKLVFRPTEGGAPVPMFTPA